MDTFFLIYNDNLLGHTHDKRMIKGFLKDFPDPDNVIVERVEVSDELRDSGDFDLYEIYRDDFYDLVTSHRFLDQVGIYCETEMEYLDGHINRLRDTVKLIKFDDDEKEAINLFLNYMKMMSEDIDIGDYSNTLFYGDYFNIKEILKQCIYNAL